MGAKEECEKTIGALNERLEKHDESRRIVQEALHEICNGLRRRVDEMEERINKKLGEEFTKEDNRLQDTLNELRKFMSTEDDEGDEGEEILLKAIRDAESELLVTQRYELVKCDSSDKEFPALYELKVEKQVSSDYVYFEKPRILSTRKNDKGKVLLKITGGASNDEVKRKLGYRAFFYRENERDGKEYSLTRINNKNNIFSFKPKALDPGTTYNVKVKAVYQEKESEWSDIFEFSIPWVSGHVWKECPRDVDQSRKYFVDEKNTGIVTKTKNSVVFTICGHYSTIIGNTPLPPNKVTSWSIKVLRSSSNNGEFIYVGVAPSDINQNYGQNICDKYGWYFACFSASLWSGPPHNYRLKRYGPKKEDGEYVHRGDSVGVVMDTTKGKLSFALNGVNLGVAYDGIPLDKPLVPCVILGAEGDSVELDTSEVKENINPSIPVPSSIVGKSDRWDSITLTWGGAQMSSSLYQVEMDGELSNLISEATFTRNWLLPESEHTFRVRAVRGNSVSKWSDPINVRTHVPNFSESTWKDCSDVPSGDRRYYLKMWNAKVATKSTYGMSCTIIGNTPLPQNKVSSWYVKIARTQNNGDGIYIGVAPLGINVNVNDNHKKCGWYLHCNDSLLWSGPPHNYQGREYGPRKEESGKYVHTGDSVGVVMDTEKGDLSFILENKCLDAGYEVMPLDEPLVPCVLLKFEEDSVELDTKKLEVITF